MYVYDYNYGTDSELLQGGAISALKNHSSDPKNIINDCNKWERVSKLIHFNKEVRTMGKTFRLAFSHIRNNRCRTFPAGG